MLKKKTVPSLLNIKLSEKASTSLTIFPVESPSVDDPPARREFGLESPPDFSGKSGNRGYDTFVEILGKLSVTRGEDGTPPRRPSEEGTQTDFGQFRI
jgi:hypothetical protein